MVFQAYLIDGVTADVEIAARVNDLDGFSNWNLRRGVSPIATNCYWRALRSFFKHRERFDGAENPYRTHTAPGFQPPTPKALLEEDCARILLAARNYRRWSEFERSRAAALIAVLLYAGLRKSEALSLVVSDVNFASKEIRVQHGKGSWGGKKRYVPIHPELARLLQEYLRERGRRLMTDAAPEFFTSTRGSGGISASTLAAIVRALVLASGVHFTPHMLRHSFVTHLLRGGAKLHEARDLAGHSHIETTLLYTRVFAKDKQDAIQKLSFGAP
jgi:integrase